MLVTQIWTETKALHLARWQEKDITNHNWYSIQQHSFHIRYNKRSLSLSLTHIRLLRECVSTPTSDWLLLVTVIVSVYLQFCREFRLWVEVLPRPAIPSRGRRTIFKVTIRWNHFIRRKYLPTIKSILYTTRRARSLTIYPVPKL